MEQPEIYYVLVQTFQDAVLTELREAGHGTDGEIQGAIRRAIMELRSYWEDAYRKTMERDDGGSDPASPDIEVPALLKALRDPDFETRSKAVDTVFDRVFEEDDDALSTPQSVARCAPYQIMVPALIEALQDSPAPVRRAIVDTLQFLRSPVSVPALLPVLHDPHPDIRRGAAYTLEKIADPAAVPALIDTLNDYYPDVRAAATRALGCIPDASAFVPLCHALQDHHEWVRAHAATALQKVGGSAAIPVLLAAQDDPSVSVRGQIASALGQTRDVAALPGLAKAMHDPESSVAQSAVYGPGNIPDDAVIPLLVDALISRKDLHWYTISAIGRLPRAKANPALLDILHRGGTDAQRAAAAMILGISDDVIPLCGWMTKPDEAEW